MSPTTNQYKDFPLFLQQIQTLDCHDTGAILVNCPPDLQPKMRDLLPLFVSKKCLRYEVEPREKGVFAISQIFCHEVLKPIINSATDTLSAAALVHQMEKLWEESKSLNRCRYLPDIDIKTSKQRQKFGFPSSCVVWPNSRNKLNSIQEILGLHSPYGYVAKETFGAVFNCH